MRKTWENVIWMSLTCILFVVMIGLLIAGIIHNLRGNKMSAIICGLGVMSIINGIRINLMYIDFYKNPKQTKSNSYIKHK